MAGIQDAHAGVIGINFRHQGRQYFLTLGKISGRRPGPSRLRLITCCCGSIRGCSSCRRALNVRTFVKHDGKVPAAATAPEPAPVVTLAAFRDRYLATHRPSMESRTIEGIESHFARLDAVLGERFPVRELKLADLQGYVDRRAQDAGRNGRQLSPATIKKELASLRAAWHWGVAMELVAGRFPNRGLRFAKTEEPPPFQTRAEIERRLAAGGLTTHQVKELWNALFLTLPEIAELLAYLERAGTLPWVYPMVAFAAHTGARRGEMLRTRSPTSTSKAKPS